MRSVRLAWLVALLAGDAPAVAAEPGVPAEALVVQRVHELEWARETPLLLVSQLPGASAETRAAIAVALGRSRDAEAVEPLLSLRDDPDPGVRRAVAEALAWTGDAAAVRAWIAEEPLPSTPAARAAAEDGVLVRLLGALGQATAGSPEDLAILQDRLRAPWPVGGAAARALGRAGQRGVDVAPAVPALLARLDAGDPRVVADVAWALFRIRPSDVSPADVARITGRMDRGSYETTRAWLVRVAWPLVSDEARDGLFLSAATDPSRLVRIAVLGALRPDDVEPDVVATWLADADPWVRLAAIEALGRLGTDDARRWLGEHVDRTDDPHEQAAAIRAAGTSDPAAARDAALDPVVRAAWASALDDVEGRVALAVDADAPGAVRSAAAGALLDDEAVPGEVGERLLPAVDPAVREAAIGLLERAPAAERVRILAMHLRAETDAEVLAVGLHTLTEALRSLPAPARRVDDAAAIVDRTAGRAEPRVRAAAVELADVLGVPAPPAAPAPAARRSIVLASGDAVEVERGRPSIAAVSRIRGARVETTEGTFVIALDPAVAPYAVANFARLSEAGFFDGLVFHRVVPGFVAQTGCPRGDGWGGAGYTVPDEVSSVPFDLGSVGMARSDRDTGSSQWFVTTAPAPHLAGDYTRFGEVVGGMHVVTRLRPGSRVLRVTIERLPNAETPGVGP